MSPWRTETFRLLNQTLDEAVGFRTAQAFESLGLRTVDDLMHHLPRRYLSGTELTDLATIEQGEHVAHESILALGWETRVLARRDGRTGATMNHG